MTTGAKVFLVGLAMGSGGTLLVCLAAAALWLERVRARHDDWWRDLP